MFSDTPNSVIQRNCKNNRNRPSAIKKQYSIAEDHGFDEIYDSLPGNLYGHKRPKEDYQDAYRFGRLYSQRTDVPFEQAERELETIWNDLIGPVEIEWNEIQPVVEHAYSMNQRVAV